MAGPCPCMPLQKGTIILAAIDTVLGIIEIIIFVVALIAVAGIDVDTVSDSGYDKSTAQSAKTLLIIILTVTTLLLICQVALAIYLWRSANHRNYRGCKIWLIISVILFVLGIISGGMSIYGGVGAVNIIFSVLGLLYRLYFMFVVYSFMKELTGTATHNV